MFDANLLTDDLPTVATPWLKNLHAGAVPVFDQNFSELQNSFINEADRYFRATELNTITGLDAFSVREAIIGCNHAIDSLIMQHGIDGLQIFEHDYKYYQRLDPVISYAKPGQLVSRKPILMAMPSPGYLGLHPNQIEILDEALEKNCEVHMDCAWLGAARGIAFDFSHPAITSVFMSLSKSMDLWWNRIGVRYTKIQDDTNPITIYNKHGMIPSGLLKTGLRYIRCVQPDHVWIHFNDRYMAMCKHLYLRPTAMIHVAQSLDRKQMFGVKKLLERV
jgi:hypothetical protein